MTLPLPPADEVAAYVHLLPRLASAAAGAALVCLGVWLAVWHNRQDDKRGKGRE